ncbi:hypothetical protein FQR65_LT09411 [Abscondita terminalis]|nr:hypothetical protein FQR65_LT09411 [Abscondita terminalis]
MEKKTSNFLTWSAGLIKYENYRTFAVVHNIAVEMNEAFLKNNLMELQMIQKHSVTIYTPCVYFQTN